MGAQHSRKLSSESDENTANGTKSLSRSWNMEFIIAARPMGIKLYPKREECLQIVSVNPEGVGNVVGLEYGDRILAVNQEDFGDSDKILQNLQNCKLPMTLQVYRPDEVSDVESEPFSYSRSISVESTTTCNLCAVCNLEDTTLYMNPCYHDVCHACWQEVLKKGGPQKCPICRFPVKSTHPISHYHVPTRTMLLRLKPFLEVNLKFPHEVVELIFEFLTFQYEVGDKVVVRDVHGAREWIEGTVSATRPFIVSTYSGEICKQWPEILPIDEPRPEVFNPCRSASSDWPWPRPLNSQSVLEDSGTQTYSRNFAPKWFRGRKYYRNLMRLENELVAGLPCRLSRTWSQSARPSSSLLFTRSDRPAPSRRGSMTVSEGSSQQHEFTLSSFSAESFGVCSCGNRDRAQLIRNCTRDLESISRRTMRYCNIISRRINDNVEDVEKQELERMKQIVDFVHRLKARKS